MSEEITETAKAVQEVAKTTKEAICITEKLGKFVSGLIHEPANVVVSILTDRLKYMRWERQIRLLERMRKLVNEKNLSVDLISVPPKIALPIIENASLEEDDYLQDMWARLFIEGGNTENKKNIRVAYIDVIKQLERIDAEILKSAYLASFEAFERYKEVLIKHNIKSDTSVKQTDLRLSSDAICKSLRINYKEYEASFDNLFRLRCLRTYIDEDNIDIPDNEPSYGGRSTTSYTFSHDEQYSAVCITQFGYEFVELCMGNINSLSK